MATTLFNDRDLRDIRERGMTPEEVLAQVERFRKGFPFCRLERPCTVGDGIVALEPAETTRLSRVYDRAALAGRAMGFVPASGAASRMFKSLLSIHGRAGVGEGSSPAVGAGKSDPEERDFLEFIRGIRKYAFFEGLKSTMARDGLDLESELRNGLYKAVLDYVLTPRGLNLSELPKGLIPFHVYPKRVRTAFEEHLAEASLYMKDGRGLVRIHFTVSREHRSMAERHLEEVRPLYEDPATTYEVTFSEQEPATDTIAVNMNNEAFRDIEGRLVFRPGGHGALLRNLNGLRGDIVFLKNIDNVVPDRLKDQIVFYQKALGGYLVELQDAVFGYQGRLSGGERDGRLLSEIADFLRLQFPSSVPDRLNGMPEKERADFLTARLNRPLRVCGMVRNEGEPGGGPFWVRHADGTLSPQIVESSQVDMKSKEQRAVWEASTHFNPVDLACGLRDFRGAPFNVMEYTDPDTGFISVKSKDGRELKALELPGLWNGAMARWNTVFVEIPSSTFNPVKTVLDLLRPAHQPG
ncbi:MAG: DUF4301 family protein [Thermodesulfobacteriota bacterium]